MILIVDKEQSGEPMDMVTLVMTFDNGKADQVKAGRCACCCVGFLANSLTYYGCLALQFGQIHYSGAVRHRVVKNCMILALGLRRS